MWLDLGLHFVLLVLLATPGTEGSRRKFQIPPLDGLEDFNLRNALADCGEDINPSMCNSLAIIEDCKNSTIRENCNFSCSSSGQLWWAASKGYMTEVNTAITAGANLLCTKTFTKDNHIFQNMTALHIAALSNYPGVVMALLDADVNVNLQTTHGTTPTYYASQFGSTDALEILIEYNADVNIAESKGWTPLMRAATSGQLSTAKALISANASLDVTGGWDDGTALYHAIDSNIYAPRPYNPDISLLLIEHKADVNIPASDGTTPLMLAAQWRMLSEAEALINANASINATGGRENATALYYAVEDGYVTMVLLLIDNNADVNIPNSEGMTPLMLAAQKLRWTYLRIAKALINANASLDVTGGRENATALYYATVYEKQDLALLLIEHNANANIPAMNGLTPLMYAAQMGDLSMAKVLINANDNLDVKGGWDNGTALYYAAVNDQQDIASLLIDHNADVNIPDADGLTPLMAAVSQSWVHLSTVKVLINGNTSLDVTGGSGDDTALHFAARTCYDNQNVVLILLQSGVDTMVLNKDGRTPADIARLSGHNQLAELIESYTTTTMTTEEVITNSESTGTN